ncbi:EthD family reductase [Algibacter sp. L3A6]|uniref:EthD family reductase n=1 Tax=Algibacter sp. L3A6 TaxID=2686366 RepID=UPI0018EF1E1D|nr:EthD family reductase [Algibacter sp. L3A6]
MNKGMIKLSALYPKQEGSHFDIDYYCNIHTPMVVRLLGDSLKHSAVEQGLSGFERGSESTFMACGHLYFDSIDEMHKAFEPYLDEIMGDIKNYTNVTPYFQISEVKI